MVRDNRRIAAPENCLSPNSFRESKDLKPLVDDKGLRCDDRSFKALKSISLHVGIVPTVTGSAYIECGKTKIICSVNGPRDVLHKNESSAKGQLFCEFKYAMFSCTERQPYMPTDEEQAISKTIQDALEPVILLHKFPKSRLDIIILVLEDDGGAISSAITCAGAALSNAGVEMYDLPIGCSLVHCDSQFLVDPTANEELYSKTVKDCAKIAIAMMVEYKSQIIFMDSCGSVNQGLLSESLKILQTSCQQILTYIRHCLKQHVEDIRAENEEESKEGSMSKKAETQLKLFQPQKYLSAFLENDIRLGNRTITEFRAVLINTNPIDTANGSALVKIGDTSVICGIKAELTNPNPDEPNKGFFVPNVNLTPICSNKYQPGPPTEQAQVYSQMVMDLWKNSSFIDATNLCVAEGKLSWCLYADMTCISYDGNALDACILALMAALRSTKLPEVVVDDQSNKIEVKETEVGLAVDFFVFSATYAVLDGRAIADPSLEEESLAESSVTVFLKDSEEMSVHATGSVKEELLFQCIDNSRTRFSNVKALIENLN
ncbi:hypothetical protein JTE90_003017 [Oedothorax gibbosus]|uniref:Ribosomal RNA-processing protein 43 n=1 Tax=Oedothorax gibbosus TaxID=931172 RepID=A0AAV6VDH4_9ARAC|nr:hypothetical protein JTE90_003017 [Oedothorax gibbosus]